MTSKSMLPANSITAVGAQLPDPPYPTDTKANGYKPEFDPNVICASDTWLLAEQEERPWLLMIWLECWRSVPCGSMPSNLELFARQIGTRRQYLVAHQETLLRNWEKCSDGRLYHPYITGLVLRMISKRGSARTRQQRARESRSRAASSDVVTRESHVSHTKSRVSHAAEQEQEQETGKTSLSFFPPRPGEDCEFVPNSTATPSGGEKKKTSPPCPYGQINDLWHDILVPPAAAMRSPDRWPSARRSRVRSLWQSELPVLDDWLEAFQAMQKSEFLMGHRPPSRGRTTPFRLTLDFIITPRNWSRFLEGHFDNGF